MKLDISTIGSLHAYYLEGEMRLSLILIDKGVTLTHTSQVRGMWKHFADLENIYVFPEYICYY